jgi:hypothetical protein
MTFNSKDGKWYMTAAEYAADTVVKAKPAAQAYVYETGKTHVTDGTTWHELGAADA